MVVYIGNISKVASNWALKSFSITMFLIIIKIETIIATIPHFFIHYVFGVPRLWVYLGGWRGPCGPTGRLRTSGLAFRVQGNSSSNPVIPVFL